MRTVVEPRGQRGFTFRPHGEYLRVSCDSCEALVINGVPCHETGCPNQCREVPDDE